MSEIFVVTDVHGCYLSLLNLLEVMGVTDDDIIVNLGDSIDRGPRIKETLDFFKNRKNVINILGNHDFHFMEYIRTGPRMDNVYMLPQGLQETLDQLGDEAQAYADWIRTWRTHVPSSEIDPKNDKYMFCHATWPWNDGGPFAHHHLWSRWYIDERTVYAAHYNGPIIVHGHTPVGKDHKDIYEYNKKKSVIGINLDGGCVYSARLGNACLRGMRLSDAKIFEVDSID